MWVCIDGAAPAILDDCPGEQCPPHLPLQYRGHTTLTALKKVSFQTDQKHLKFRLMLFLLNLWRQISLWRFTWWCSGLSYKRNALQTLSSFHDGYSFGLSVTFPTHWDEQRECEEPMFSTAPVLYQTGKRTTWKYHRIFGLSQPLPFHRLLFLQIKPPVYTQCHTSQQWLWTHYIILTCKLCLITGQ